MKTICLMIFLVLIGCTKKGLPDQDLTTIRGVPDRANVVLWIDVAPFAKIPEIPMMFQQMNFDKLFWFRDQFDPSSLKTLTLFATIEDLKSAFPLGVYAATSNHFREVMINKLKMECYRRRGLYRGVTLYNNRSGSMSTAVLKDSILVGNRAGAKQGVNLHVRGFKGALDKRLQRLAMDLKGSDLFLGVIPTPQMIQLFKELLMAFSQDLYLVMQGVQYCATGIEVVNSEELKLKILFHLNQKLPVGGLKRIQKTFKTLKNIQVTQREALLCFEFTIKPKLLIRILKAL